MSTTVNTSWRYGSMFHKDVIIVEDKNINRMENNN